MIEEWLKNGPKVPTVNDPNNLYEKKIWADYDFEFTGASICNIILI